MGTDQYGRTLPPAGSFARVGAGYYHSCGLKTDGTLACWSRNANHGQATPPAGTFVDLSVGWHHACAIRTDGTLTCWGKNSHGQAAPPSGEFIAVAAGSGQSCAIAVDETVVCWGYDGDGQASPPPPNLGPVIDSVYESTDSPGAGETAVLQIYAHDPEGAELTYDWSTTAGSLGAPLPLVGGGAVTRALPLC